jgi:hypothetical protein
MDSEEFEDLTADLRQLALAVEQLATVLMAMAGRDEQLLIGRVRRSVHRIVSPA